MVTTLGSRFDTVLTAYASNVDNLTGIVAENDDLQLTNPTQTSGVKIPVQKGVVYEFAVDGKNGETGEIALTIIFSYAVKDDFASRKMINAFPLTTSGSNRGSSRQFDEPYHAVAGRNSVWWQWTAPIAGSVRISTKGSSFPAGLAVYTGSVLRELTSLTSISGGNDLNLAVEAGQKYQLAVDGAYGDTGDIELRIDRGEPPGNDDFIHATPIPGAKAEIAASNLYASVEPGEEVVRTIGGGRTVWWSWTAPTNGLITVRAIGGSLNTDLMLFTGTALSNLRLVAENDNFLLTPTILDHPLDRRLSIDVETGVTYFIRVDNSQYARAGGPFILKLDFSRPPKILPGVSLQNGMFRFKATGLAGIVYHVQTSENLRDWTGLPGDYVGEDLTVIIPSGTGRAGFFRLVDNSVLPLR